MSAHAFLWNPRAEARYVRFSVRWTEATLPRAMRERPSIGKITAATTIAAIDIAVVRDRPLLNTTLPLQLPTWRDAWF